MTKREAALREFIKLLGTVESGGANRGPVVDKITSADALPGIGYAWCQSAANYVWKLANREMLANGTASVGFFVSWAKQKGYIVTRPYRGDHVAFHFDGNENWADHVGMVEKVLQLGPTFILQTIEGNTSSGDAGSQDDGDGIYRRRRVVLAKRVVFIRVPGEQPPPPTKTVVVYEVVNNGKVIRTSDHVSLGGELMGLNRFLRNRTPAILAELKQDKDCTLQLRRTVKEVPL